MSATIREITVDDLGAVLALLYEGFPERPRGYWRAGLDIMAARPPVDGLAQFGFMVEAGGQAQGVLLLLTSRREAGPLGNMSSWYVREDHRNQAIALLRATLRARGTTYLNLSPSERVAPIIKVFGFEPYTAGALLFDPRCLTARGGRVVGLAPGMALAADAGIAASLEAHGRYGCTPLIVHDQDGAMPALFRVKRVKRVIPAAQFLWGDPRRLVRNAGAVMRWLARRGIALALVDAPPDLDASTLPTGVTWLPAREIRYAKGGMAPAPGDLRETELAIFGP